MNLKDIIGDLDSLSADQRQAAIDAFQDILNARAGLTTDQLPPEMDMDVDPELENPELEDMLGDVQFDDPDNVLKPQKNKNSPSASSNSKSNSQSNSDEDEDSDSTGDSSSDSSSSSKGNSKKKSADDDSTADGDEGDTGEEGESQSDTDTNSDGTSETEGETSSDGSSNAEDDSTEGEEGSSSSDGGESQGSAGKDGTENDSDDADGQNGADGADDSDDGSDDGDGGSSGEDSDSKSDSSSSNSKGKAGSDSSSGNQSGSPELSSTSDGFDSQENSDTDTSDTEESEGSNGSKAGTSDDLDDDEDLGDEDDYNFDSDRFDDDPNSDKVTPSKDGDSDSKSDDHKAPEGDNLRKIDLARTIDLGNKTLEKAERNSISGTGLLKQLLEKLKNLSEEEIKNMTDDQFTDLINQVVDAADQLVNVNYSSDIDARIEQIKQSTENPEDIEELSKEDDEILQKEQDKKDLEQRLVKAREQEKLRYANASLKPLTSFFIDFTKAIGEQVEDMYDEDDEDTWSVLNRKHDNDGVVAPGSRVIDIPGADIPVINVYLDCSGSWDRRDTEIGLQAVKSVIGFEERGEIKTNVLYFANHVHSDYESAAAEGGTAAWPEILDNIQRTKAKNVVILTDSDMNWLADSVGRHVTVEGNVWYIWKNGSSAPYLPYYLRGRRGTSQYNTRG